MTPRGAVRSSALRLAAGVSGLFVGAILLAVVASYELIARELEGGIRADIEAEMDELEAVLARGGQEALRTEVALHAASGTGWLIRYQAPDGETLGNVAAVPDFAGWRVLEDDAADALRPVEGVEVDDPYVARSEPMGGGVLTLARSAAAVEEAQEIVARALAVGLGAALACSLAGAAWIARRTEARIGRIAQALERAAAGDLAARASGAGDPADDLVRVAAAIDATLDRLADAMASLRQVSADIAHDLKTPVQRLRGTLEALRRDRVLDPRAEAVVEDALAQADALVRTFQALLRIAQIEGGSPRARFAPVDLAELVQAVGEAFGPALEESGHRFALRLPDGAAPFALGDRDLLAQMLSNLLANAQRHAPPPADVALSLEVAPGEARLVVADTGPGIPEAERERVFRRLYRLERSRTTEGSGLGLAMVAAVAQLHGATAALEDARPGLRAVVRLPLIEG